MKKSGLVSIYGRAVSDVNTFEDALEVEFLDGGKVRRVKCLGDARCGDFFIARGAEIFAEGYFEEIEEHGGGGFRTETVFVTKNRIDVLSGNGRRREIPNIRLCEKPFPKAVSNIVSAFSENTPLVFEKL